MKAKRSRFLARAATANWDAVIITHAAFRFIPVPSAFEQADDRGADRRLRGASLTRADKDDRITRKRLEATEGEARAKSSPP